MQVRFAFFFKSNARVFVAYVNNGKEPKNKKRRCFLNKKKKRILCISFFPSRSTTNDPCIIERQRLFDFGLRPETCIACAFHYLFRPNAAVERLYSETFRSLADKDILKIGLAIRVGDAVFGGSSNGDNNSNNKDNNKKQDNKAYLPRRSRQQELNGDSAS